MISINLRLKPTENLHPSFYKPRVPYSKRYGEEGEIFGTSQSDDLITKPETAKFILDNKISRTYARPQLFTGEKWITFPHLPSQTINYAKGNINVPSGTTKDLLVLKGQGELQYFCLASDISELRFGIVCDRRESYNLPLSDIWWMTGGDRWMGFGKISRWDDVSEYKTYAFIGEHVEKFTERFRFWVKTPMDLSGTVTVFTIHLHVHEVREYLEEQFKPVFVAKRLRVAE